MIKVDRMDCFLFFLPIADILIYIIQKLYENHKNEHTIV